MDFSEIVNNYGAYRQIAHSVDLATVGMNICVLLVLLIQVGKEGKKIKRSFIYYIALVLLIITSEMIAWGTVFRPEYATLYEIAVIADYFLCWLAPGVMFHLVNCVIEYKVKLNKTFRMVYLSLYLLFDLPILIPPFRDLIIVFDTERAFYQIGPMAYYYYSLEAVLVLFGLCVGWKNAKKIGVADTVVVSLFILIPLIFIYWNTWWASIVEMLFMTFCLMILFGITYQKRLVFVREREKEKQIALADTRMKLLLSQIHPHFLYNTLTTLKFLCETAPEEASALCDSFAGYLRSNIDAASDSGLVSFEKELSNIENYLRIEKARFGERVKYRFDIPISSFSIPVLCIQTIVENAVKKGICAKKQGGTVVVSTEEKEDSYIVTVRDDGVGFDMNTYLSDGKNHVGLENTRERLLLVGGNIEVSSEIGKGTVVTVTVPKGEDQ